MKIYKNFLIIFIIFLFDCFQITFVFGEVKIAFYSTSLGFRGTEVALYDYAHFNETILGNISYIFNNKNNHPITEKFQKRFGERCYFGFSLEELNEVILQEGIDIVYTIKAGEEDGLLFKHAKNAVHAVFNILEPHGDRFASISDWLNERFQKQFPVVPHMIHLDDTTESLRKELGIPEEAIVFGRHGGAETFDLKVAHEAITQVVQERSDIWFVFLNTDSFFDHERIIYLPPTDDLIKKTQFINTCDAMIHARSHGETFGLACGEFSIKNKPVITCKYGDLAHIKILGKKGIYYDPNQTASLVRIFRKFRKTKGNFDAYSENYNPEVVMKQFKKVFIDENQEIESLSEKL